MIRTLISIDKDTKHWLDTYSYQKHQSIAETIRSAIAHFRKSSESTPDGGILNQTAGLWKEKNIDGLNYVESLRKEWE